MCTCGRSNIGTGTTCVAYHTTRAKIKKMPSEKKAKQKFLFGNLYEFLTADGYAMEMTNKANTNQKHRARL